MCKTLHNTLNKCVCEVHQVPKVAKISGTSNQNPSLPSRHPTSTLHESNPPIHHLPIPQPILRSARRQATTSTTMLPLIRSTRLRAVRTLPTYTARYSSTETPLPPTPGAAPSPSPVSSTNDKPPTFPVPTGYKEKLVESVEKGEEMRRMQAPNREGTWSRSQRPREMAMVGPRFEQTIFSLQVS